MNIKPSNSSGPKYPALATLAVAVAMSTAACGQQQRLVGKVSPQRTAGVPRATPEQVEQLRQQRQKKEADKADQPRERQRLGGARRRIPGQIVPGKAKRPSPKPAKD